MVFSGFGFSNISKLIISFNSKAYELPVVVDSAGPLSTM